MKVICTHCGATHLIRQTARLTDEVAGKVYLCLVAVAAITILSAAIITHLERTNRDKESALASEGVGR